MNDIAVVQRLMDGIVDQDLEPGLDLIAEDVQLTVLPTGAGAASAETLWGRRAVRDNFEALGGIVAFWQLHFVADGDRVLVLGTESYTTNHGMQADSEFMLVCQVRDGLIDRMLVVEDLSDEATLRPTIFREAADLEEAVV